MAKKQAQATLTLEGETLAHARNVWGKTSPIFGAQKGKVVTLLGTSATLMGEWLETNPVVKQEDIPMAKAYTHEIKRKNENQAGWTWVKFDGRIADTTSAALKALGFKYSHKRVAFYAQSEIAEKVVRKTVKV